MFFSDNERRKLLENGIESRGSEESDHYPVVKLFTPDARATWLITEISADDNTIAFGLCDLGVGMPELGYVSLTDLDGIRGPLGLRIEKDVFFQPTKRISEYAAEARVRQRILV